jgi:hypothetical protein
MAHIALSHLEHLKCQILTIGPKIPIRSARNPHFSSFLVRSALREVGRDVEVVYVDGLKGIRKRGSAAGKDNRRAGCQHPETRNIAVKETSGEYLACSISP